MWKPVDESEEHFEGEDDGGYDDSMFFGLEEIDGNSYTMKKSKHGYMHVTVTSNKKQKKDSCQAKETSGSSSSSGAKKAEAKDSKESRNVLSDIEKYTNVPQPSYTRWDKIELHTELTSSLESLGFHTPTPIQASAIPAINTGESDVVGAAETGSGKTLAFSLPIINSLLKDWVQTTTARIKHGILCPYALIIVPTRELAMQIASVIKEVSLAFRKTYRMEVVTVVGGMSEHKQRRQLEGKTAVHFLVATPGRLCELLDDESLPVFRDMSYLRYLVVDEADRIVEEGHFAELHRVFSRIRDHEKLAIEEGTGHGNDDGHKKEDGKEDYHMNVDEDLLGQGEDEVQQAIGRLKRRQASMLSLDDEVPLAAMPNMPSDKELARAKAQQSKKPYDEMSSSEDEEDGEDGEGKEDEEDEEDEEGHDAGSSADSPYENKRQTLLFSATALRIQGLKQQHGEGKKGGMKKRKKPRPLPGLAPDLSAQLPEHVHQLMSLVGSRPKVDLVDVTSADALSTLEKGKQGSAKKRGNDKEENDDEGGEEKGEGNATAMARNLPKHLTHMQVNSPTEEKDVYAYYYLHCNPGKRVLVFVNSIKTARRLDGLLRALNLNCRVIHAQLQQRQRIRALESFQKSSNGILVATDVAARGLDIADIDTVVHYDVARSPQVYIHRSGRTARANRAGISISMVSPEDHIYHSAIVNVVGKAVVTPSGEGGKLTKTDKMKAKLGGLEDFSVDTAALGVLRQRCTLAKKIFLQSFLHGQEQKDSTWLRQTSSAADIEVDDQLAAELQEEMSGGAKGMAKGISKGGKGGHGNKLSKKELERLRWELRKLLSTSVATSTSGIGSRKKGFFVVGATNV